MIHPKRLLGVAMGLVVAPAPLLLLTCLSACTPTIMPTPEPDAGQTVSFAQHIQPIFDNRCASCHRAGSPTGLFVSLQLTSDVSYGRLVNHSSSQNPSLTLVKPGDAAGSLLFQKVSSNSPPVGSRMPLLSSPLSATQIALIRDWIDQGALEN